MEIVWIIVDELSQSYDCIVRASRGKPAVVIIECDRTGRTRFKVIYSMLVYPFLYRCHI